MTTATTTTCPPWCDERHHNPSPDPVAVPDAGCIVHRSKPRRITTHAGRKRHPVKVFINQRVSLGDADRPEPASVRLVGDADDLTPGEARQVAAALLGQANRAEGGGPLPCTGFDCDWCAFGYPKHDATPDDLWYVASLPVHGKRSTWHAVRYGVHVLH